MTNLNTTTSSASQVAPNANALRRSLAYGVAVLLAVAFFWLNLRTSLSFGPWIDEVMQVDAGINLHLGKGWVSTAWQHQSQYEFLAANNPIYTLLIYFWASLVGIEPVAVRALNYILVLGIAWLVVDTCKRKGLLKSFWSRLLLAALLVTNSAVTYVYRSGRADLLTLLVVVLLARVYVCVEDPGKRQKLLFLFALPILAAGMQAIPYIVLLLALEFMVTRKLRLKDLTAIVTGTAVGGFLLALVYLWKHSFKAFVFETFASGYNIVGSGLQAVIIHDHTAVSRFLDQLKAILPWNIVANISRDNSLIPLILFLVAAVFLTRKSPLRSLFLIGVIAAFFIPFGMLAAGRYAFYYSWMGSVPVAILFVVALEQILREKNKLLLALGLVAATASLLLGMPFDIWQQTHQAGPQSYAEVVQLLQKEVKPGDELLGDPVFYYAAKEQGIPFYSDTYAGGRTYRHMSDAEDSRLTLMILRPDQFDECAAKAGGNWTKGESYPLSYGFTVTVWRRPANSVPAHN